MYKIYLAINHKELENFIIGHKSLIEKNLKQEVEFVGRTVYREGVLPGIEDCSPDLLILRESLPGKEQITDLIYNIRVKSSKTRIIFITTDREVGDPFLGSLVNMGVYDLLIGNKVDAKEMLKKIVFPNDISDVAYLMPKVNIDEKTNKATYETLLHKHHHQKHQKQRLKKFLMRSSKKKRLQNQFRLNQLIQLYHKRKRNLKNVDYLVERKNLKPSNNKLSHSLVLVKVLETPILHLTLQSILQIKDLMFFIWI